MPGGPAGRHGAGRAAPVHGGARVPGDAALRPDRGVPGGRGGLPARRVRGRVPGPGGRRGGSLMAEAKTVTLEDVKKLRDMTGAGMMDCRKALEDSGGDVDR